MKKVLSFVLMVCMIATAVVLPATAMATDVEFPDAGVYSKEAISFTGSSQVIGDAITLSGKSTCTTPDLTYVTGTLYTKGDTDYRANFAGNVAAYTGKEYNYEPYTYAAVPEASFFAGNTYNDGTINLATSWYVPQGSVSQIMTGSTLTESAYVKSLEIINGSELNVQVNRGEILTIVAEKVTNNGTLNVIGGGRLVIYATSMMTSACGTHINVDGGSNNLTIVCADGALIRFSDAACNVVALGNLTFYAEKYSGNIYCNHKLEMLATGSFTGMVYAPFSDTILTGDATIYGKIITKSLQLIDNCKVVNKGVTDGLRLVRMSVSINPMPIGPVVTVPTIDVVEYDVETGIFSFGTMKTRAHVPDVDFFVTYTVLDEYTFVANNKTVPQELMYYCELILEANEDVLQDMMRIHGDESVTPFGRIDSEAWDNGLTVSPYSTSILESQGFHYSEDQLWLAMADRAGTVTKVWLAVPGTIN